MYSMQSAIAVAAVMVAATVAEFPGVDPLSLDSCASLGADRPCAASLLQQHIQLVGQSVSQHERNESLHRVRGLDLAPVSIPSKSTFWTVAHKGKVYGGPAQVNNFIVYDIASETVSKIPVTLQHTGFVQDSLTSNDFDWMGIALNPELDQIYACPFNSDYIVAYDIGKNLVSSVSSAEIAKGSAKWNGVTVHKNKAYFAPANADQVLVYDAISGLVSGASTSHIATGEWKWAWGQGYGDDVYLGPNSVAFLLKYDTNTNQVTGIPFARNFRWGWTGLTIYNDKIFTTPNADDYVYVYNLLDHSESNISTAPCTASFFTVPGPASDGGGTFCLRQGGGVGHGGKVYMGAYDGYTILVVDAETLTVSTITSSVPESHSGISIWNNTLYQMPYSGTTMMLTIGLD